VPQVGRKDLPDGSGGTFSLATSGRLSENHFSCCFTREIILPYWFFTMLQEPMSLIVFSGYLVSNLPHNTF